MTNFVDPYDKKFSELGSEEQKNLEATYRRLGEYYTRVCESNSNTIFNWGFTLNTGGLAATVAFMHKLTTQLALSFFTLILIFTLGLISIVLAMFLEAKRFKIKGNSLENKMQELDEDKITGSAFLSSNIYPNETDCYYKIVSWAEKSSYILFFIGLLISLIIIFLAFPSLGGPS